MAKRRKNVVVSELSTEMLNAERDAQRRALERNEEAALSELRKRAPIDDGDYYNSLFAEVPKDRLQLILGAEYKGSSGGGGNHAHLIEFGTGPRVTKGGADRGAGPALSVIRKAALATRRDVFDDLEDELRRV